MSASFSEAEEILFDKTGEGVLRRLRKTRNPADLLAVVRSAHLGFDRAYATAPLAARDQVACRAGCGACCSVPVGVQAHEVLIVAEYIQRTFSPEALAAVIAAAAAHRARYAGLTNPEQAELKSPCVLLKDGSCSVYEARPEACRSHHSHNARACGNNLDPRLPYVDVYIPEIRGRMFAVMLAIDQAVAEAGFDGQAYDFGSALHEALTNGLCAIRWMQRQSAFPANCHEAADTAEGETGLMKPEGYFD